MTIAIGILCEEGIVLCADSQETINEYSKAYRPKAFKLDLVHDDVAVVFTGAGDAVFLDALRDKIEVAIDLVAPTLDEIAVKIEETIISYCKKVWPLYATQRDRPDAEMLIGIRAPDGMKLLHCSGPIVRSISDFECIGFGGDFSRYHIRRFFSGQKMNVNAVCTMAAYILEIVKDNVEFCGGDSHLFIIHANGNVEQKTQDYITGRIAAFKVFATQTDKLIARSQYLLKSEKQLIEEWANHYEELTKANDREIWKEVWRRIFLAMQFPGDNEQLESMVEDLTKSTYDRDPPNFPI